MKKACFAALMVLALSSAAQALILTPGDLNQVLTGDQTSQAQINNVLNNFGVGEEVYKQNVGGPEVGVFAPYYTTTYSNSPTDPNDAEITWVVGSGTNFITNPGYLLVKDGNNNPAWYLFNISGWNGMETIFLNDFWQGNGAISHVSIYGGPPSEVPEPATMLLFGTGLIGLAGASRRARKQ